MEFVMVNGRTPRQPSFCALCRESIGESYLREIATRLFYCAPNCYVPSWYSRILRGRRNNFGPEEHACKWIPRKMPSNLSPRASVDDARDGR
jgi:hypothetical protein